MLLNRPGFERQILPDELECVGHSGRFQVFLVCRADPWHVLEVARYLLLQPAGELILINGRVLRVVGSLWKGQRKPDNKADQVSASGFRTPIVTLGTTLRSKGVERGGRRNTLLPPLDPKFSGVGGPKEKEEEGGIS